MGDPLVPTDHALGLLHALGLQPADVIVPTPVLELGAELISSADVPFANFAFHPGMSIIMPTERTELVQIEMRQFYRIPATHCATGALVFLTTPVEMGPPPVIFGQFPQFRSLEPPVLPSGCDWLQAHESHSVHLVTRCVSFP